MENKKEYNASKPDSVIYTDITLMLDHYRDVLDKIFNIYYERKDVPDGYFSSCYHGRRLVTITINIQRDCIYFCFNCSHREVLYAIRFCIKNYHGYESSEFRECVYGKALNYRHEDLPSTPPFENIMYYYQKQYFMRLSLIDHYFESLEDRIRRHIQHNSLKAKKETIWNYPDSSILYLPLPEDVINQIVNFLKYIHFKKSLELRKCYEKSRANLNTLSILKN